MWYNLITMKLRLLVLATILAMTAFAALPVLAQPDALLDADAQADLEDNDRAFLEASGLQPTHPSVIISVIIRVVLSFLGVVFVILIIYSGLRWMTSAGNEEQIAKSKRTMVAAIIGLAIVLGAYIITTFVLDAIFRATIGAAGNQ